MNFLKKNRKLLFILAPLFVITIVLGFLACNYKYKHYKICMIFNGSVQCEDYNE